jgi:formylglycine-generating enzyme required for sulfatase activity
MKRVFIGATVLAASLASCGDRRPPAPARPETRAAGPESRPLPTAFEQTIPGATAVLHMVPVPPVAPGGPPFFVSSSEVPWEIYDVFALRLDDPAGAGAADAITRPSRPYLPPDRGWGHEGYPAMSITFEGANRFCDWLSRRTGRRYRLPTETEWEHAARAGSAGRWSCGDDAAALADHAWYAANSEGTTRPVGAKKPNAWGLHDVHGNVAEWAITADLKAVTCGGSYRDDPAGVASAARARPSPAWQRSDPQIPKSPWWLTDGPFVGFRVVTDSNGR